MLLRGAPQRRSFRAQAISLLIQLALFAIIFGWLLPKIIDYQEVWDAIQELTWWEFLVLLAIGMARIPTEAMIYRALLPGLHLRVGTEAYLSQNFAGTFLPPPTSSIVQYAYFHSDGFEERLALIGAVDSCAAGGMGEAFNEGEAGSPTEAAAPSPP